MVYTTVAIPSATLRRVLRSAHSAYWCSDLLLDEEDPMVYLSGYDHVAGARVTGSVVAGLRALSERAPLAFGRLLARDAYNFDGPDADVLLQCCLFGEVKYG